MIPIYYVYPTSWYDPNKPQNKDIENKVVNALQRIKKDIIIRNRNNKSGNKLEINTNTSLWQIFHSDIIARDIQRDDIIVFYKEPAIREGDYIVYEIMRNKLAGLFKVTKKLYDTDIEYETSSLIKEIFGFPMRYQYKIEPVLKFFNRPLDKNTEPALNKFLTTFVKNRYAVKLDINHITNITDIFFKHSKLVRTTFY